MLTAIFLLLNSEGIPRTVVSKNGKHFMSFSVSFGDDEDNENDGSLVVKLLVNFCLLAGGDFSNLSSSSSSVSES